MGYDIFISVDLDEFLFPISSKNTAIDELVDWFRDTQRRIMPLPKHNFNPIPHILEPINLLTIEAYQERTKDFNRMNYYKTVCKFDVFLPSFLFLSRLFEFDWV
jgi:hypothetical protein